MGKLNHGLFHDTEQKKKGDKPLSQEEIKKRQKEIEEALEKGILGNVTPPGLRKR